VVRLVDLYRRAYEGWNVKHFYRWYQRDHGGERSYSWVKKTLQAYGVVALGQSRYVAPPPQPFCRERARG